MVEDNDRRVVNNNSFRFFLSNAIAAYSSGRLGCDRGVVKDVARTLKDNTVS